MAPLDLTLLVVFSVIGLLALASAVLCFRKALRVSNEKNGDLKMFFWAVGTFAGLVVAGMSASYIILPLLFH